MVEAKSEAEIESFWAIQEDAWMRTSEIVAMVHNTTRTKESDCKPPREFNLLLKSLAHLDAPAAEEPMDWSWAKKEEGHQNGLAK